MSAIVDDQGPTLAFVTDPMCSWCWGMWPEVLSLRAHYRGRAEVSLVMGGLQIGGRFEAPTDEQRRRIGEIWSEVRRVTGQRIVGRLPVDEAFFYHSEIPCRAVYAMERVTGRPPFEFFQQLHEAFYLEALNLTSPEVLAELASFWSVDKQTFLKSMRSDAVKTQTRDGFVIAHTVCGGVLPSLLGCFAGTRKLLAGGYASFADIQAPIDAWLDAVEANR